MMTTWKTRGTERRFIRWAAALTMVALPLVACGDDDDGADDEAAVETVLTGIIADFNEADGPGFAAAFTDQGLGVFFESPGASREELLDIAAGAVGSDHIAVRDITNMTIDGDTATADMELGVAELVLHERYTLVRQDGSWLIDGYESLGEE